MRRTDTETQDTQRHSQCTGGEKVEIYKKKPSEKIQNSMYVQIQISSDGNKTLLIIQ